MVEAGGTPKVKPPVHLPGVAPPGAEGVAGRTSGPTSLTAGPYLEALQLGLGQHLLVRQPDWQAQGRSQTPSGHS